MQKLKVIYEDNHIIVVEKIPNVPSQSDKTGDIDMLTMVKQYIKEKYNKYVKHLQHAFFVFESQIIYRPSVLRQRCFQHHPYDGCICRQHRSDARRQHHPDQHSEPGSQPWRLPYPRHHC